MSGNTHNPFENIKTLLAIFNIDKKDIVELAMLATKENNYHLNLKLINLLNAYDNKESTIMQETEEDLKKILKFLD